MAVMVLRAVHLHDTAQKVPQDFMQMYSVVVPQAADASSCPSLLRKKAPTLSREGLVSKINADGFHHHRLGVLATGFTCSSLQPFGR
jgi:hypothetical protein